MRWMHFDSLAIHQEVYASAIVVNRAAEAHEWYADPFSVQSSVSIWLKRFCNFQDLFCGSGGDRKRLVVLHLITDS